MSTATDSTYCVNHPQTPTGLRCNKCGQPICVKCAVRTPVGYRCRSCVSAQQQIFETALWYDYVIAAVVAAVLGGLAGALLVNMQFFVFFLAPVAGGLTAEVVRAAVRRRRGRRLALAAAGGFVLGCLPLLFMPLFYLLLGAGIRGLLGLLWPGVYMVVAASTLYARLRGIDLR